jgi:transposase-like protein
MSPQLKEAFMRYSRSVKVSILKRVLPPENRSIRSVSQETGISEQTIRNWIRASKDGNLTEAGDEKSPRFYTSHEKYHLLMEASRLSDEALGAFLRERGLHSEHLTLWDQELREMVTDKEDKRSKETKELKRRVRQLEKELARKDKALAETAALLVLKKKLDTLMEEDGDG